MALGTSLLIESIPVNFDGWVTMREPQPKEGGSESKADLPF